MLTFPHIKSDLDIFLTRQGSQHPFAPLLIEQPSIYAKGCLQIPILSTSESYCGWNLCGQSGYRDLLDF